MPTVLTPQQQAAVDVVEGAYLLSAPPGSGKTEVLVRRIGRLLADSSGQGFRVLALTFTNRAAEQIRSRIGAEVADELWRLFAGTFHAFCLEVLQAHGEPVGVRPDVTVYADPGERVDVLQQGLLHEGYDPDRLGVSRSVALSALRRIDALRADLVPPEAAPEEIIDGLDLPLPLVYAAYEHALDRFGGLDYPAMLTRTHRLLTTNAWTGRHYRRLYRYLLVDEAQDSTPVQYELLRALCGETHRNIFVVADANQSIYGFAGAAPTELLGRFEREFDATRLQLDSNFRSAKAIIGVANRLATHLRDRERIAEMVQHGSAPGHVEVRAFADEDAEGKATAAWIGGLIAEGLDPSWLEGEDAALQPEQIAVLSRTRWGLDPVASALDEAGIGYLMRTGEGGLFDSDVGNRVHDVLRVLANPRDVPTRRRLLAGAAGEAPASYSAESDPGEVLSALEGELPEPLLAALTAAARGEVAASILIAALTAPEAAEIQDDDGELWLADQQELARCWRHYTLRTPPDSVTLPGFLGALARLQRATVDEPGVRLLTVHSAKGLEFRAVAVVSFIEGTFPHYRSKTEEAVDEERRNAYVAVTRAARVLRLSLPRSKRIPGWGPRPQRPSRFLGEMGLSV